MTASTSISACGDHLRLTVVGDIRSIDEIIRFSTLYRTEAKRLGLRRVLLDYTRARFHLDYHDLLELAEYATEQNFQLDGLRLAVVCAPEHLAQHRKYETIAVNRSTAYLVFDDEDEALARLLAS